MRKIIPQKSKNKLSFATFTGTPCRKCLFSVGYKYKFCRSRAVSLYYLYQDWGLFYHFLMDPDTVSGSLKFQVSNYDRGLNYYSVVNPETGSGFLKIQVSNQDRGLNCYFMESLIPDFHNWYQYQELGPYYYSMMNPETGSRFLKFRYLIRIGVCVIISC